MVEELVHVEEPKKDIPTVELKNTVDQEEECDFKSYVLNSILDVFYDDFDMSVENLFDTDNLVFLKVNAIKSNFAYLCDVLPDGYSILW